MLGKILDRRHFGFKKGYEVLTRNDQKRCFLATNNSDFLITKNMFHDAK
jgi:hypothetical protein